MGRTEDGLAEDLEDPKLAYRRLNEALRHNKLEYNVRVFKPRGHLLAYLGKRIITFRGDTRALHCLLRGIGKYTSDKRCYATQCPCNDRRVWRDNIYYLSGNKNKVLTAHIAPGFILLYCYILRLQESLLKDFLLNLSYQIPDCITQPMRIEADMLLQDSERAFLDAEKHHQPKPGPSRHETQFCKEIKKVLKGGNLYEQHIQHRKQNP